MRKTGILTLQYADNYGAMLQCYALSTFLKQNGYPNEVINYLPIDFYANYAIVSVKYPSFWKRKVGRILAYHRFCLQRRKFRRFRRQMLPLTRKMSTESEYLKYIHPLDAVVFGSDQIWNDDIVGNAEIYFTKGIPIEKSVVYAASFGKDTLDAFQMEMLSQRLAGIRHLSVREKETLAHFEGVSKQPPKHVSDPVFLLDKQSWLRMIRVKRPRKPFILYYALSSDEQLNAYTKRLAQETNLPVLAIHPLGRILNPDAKLLNNVGPVEFLSLFSEAAYICTNSFHASCFSLIFQKNAVIVPPVNRGNRISSLLKSVNQPMVNTYHIYDLQNAQMDRSILQDSQQYLLDAISDALNTSEV